MGKILSETQSLFSVTTYFACDDIADDTFPRGFQIFF